MARELYNEGRVAGFSQYETYVKQSLEVDPNTEPASEREWLASSLAMGSSLLFKMPVDTEHDNDEVWMYEVDLPTGTRLCAANPLTVAFFKGEGHLFSDPQTIEPDPEPTPETVTYVAQINDTKYETLQEASDASVDGDTIYVIDDCKMTDTCVFRTAVTLDLGDYKIYNTRNIYDKSADHLALLCITEGGVVIIRGDGSVEAKDNDCYPIDVRNGGICVINSGTYVGNISAVYVQKGELFVNGGDFSIQTTASGDYPYGYLLDCVDTNYNSGTANITITGGTFNKWNPADNIAEGEGTNFVATGYKAIEESEDVWTVEVDADAVTPMSVNQLYLQQLLSSHGVKTYMATTDPDDVWANRVIDYGALIPNTDDMHPVSGDQSVTTTKSDDAVLSDDEGTYILNSDATPSGTMENWTDEEKAQLVNYLKILDGIVYQPGTWYVSHLHPPTQDFLPDLSRAGTMRLQIKGPIDTSFWMVITGFTIRGVIMGESGLDGSTDTPAPEDGDFLGPGQYPWAAKMTFSMPTSYAAYFELANYVRQIPSQDKESFVVDDTAVIDMKTTRPEDYYADDGDYADSNKYYYKLFTSEYSDPREPVDVDEFSSLGDGAAVLTVFQRSEKYPPALWGSKVIEIGDNHLQPLDCVAPGSVKMFYDDDGTNMQDYQDTFPGSTGMSKDDDGQIYVLDEDGNIVPAASVDTTTLSYTNVVSGDTKAKGVVTTTGKNSELSLSMGPGGGDASQYTLGNDTSSDEGLTGALKEIDSPTGNISLAMIVEALANNKSIDVLGTNLKEQKVGLTRNYIMFENGLRLYISGSEPGPDSSDPNRTDGSKGEIPIGSIGIGWE